VTPHQNASAFSRASGAMKPTESPPSTQSIKIADRAEMLFLAPHR
jgi:hypothetical protein